MQDPFLEDLRREMSEESDDSGKAGASEVQVAKHVRNITDLQPQEMARLEERFRPGGVDSGMGIEEFEKTMEEFTGMEVSLGQQLFCVGAARGSGRCQLLQSVARAFSYIAAGQQWSRAPCDEYGAGSTLGQWRRRVCGNTQRSRSIERTRCMAEAEH